MQPLSRQVGAVCGCAVLLLLANQAAAEDADKLLRDGVHWYTMGKLEPSLRALNKARKLARDPELLGHIHLYLGLNHATLRRTKRARQAFKAALSQDPTLALDPDRFNPNLVALFEQVKAGLAGTLSVTADREGAVVLVDAKELGKAPFVGKVVIGRHRVEVRTPDGAYSRLVEVVVHEGKRARLDVHLERVGRAQEQPTGVVVAVAPIRDRSRRFGPALESLSTRLASWAGKRSDFKVILPRQLRSLVGKLDDCDSQCQTDASRKLGANKLLAAYIIQQGRTCALIATMYDVTAGTAEYTASAKGPCRTEAGTRMVDRVATTLKEQLSLWDPRPPIPAAWGGLLIASTPPGAEVWLDGKKQQGATPVRLSKVPEGAHFLELRTKAHRYAGKVVVSPGQTSDISLRLEKVAGRLEVRTSPPEAEVLLDGRRVGKAPLVLGSDVTFGDHVVEVRRQGYVTAKRPVRVAMAPTLQALDVTLLELGVLAVRSQPPGANVTLDGTSVGQTPVEVQLASGLHSLRLEMTGHAPVVKPVVLAGHHVAIVHVELPATRTVARPSDIKLEKAAAKVVTAFDELSPRARRQRSKTTKDEPVRRRRVWTWVAAGAAVAAAGAAIGLWTSAVADHDEYVETKDRERFEELRESIPRRVTASNAMWGVAGGLAATSVVLFFWEPRWAGGDQKHGSQAQPAKVGVMPLVGETAGAVLTTSF